MRILKYISIILLAIVTYSCEETTMPLFDAQYSFVYFDETSARIQENSAKLLEIPVTVAGIKGNDVQVSFVVEGTGKYPAIEGTDYNILNSGKKVTITGGTGVGMILIEPINNDVFSNNKTFNIQIDWNDAGFFIADSGNNVITTTIIDDDLVSPLSFLFGSYVQNDYYYPEGEHDEYSPYDVTISYIEGSETQVSINNFWGAGFSVIAEVDVEAGTVNILPGQIIYIDSEYGNCYAVSIDLDAGANDMEAVIQGKIDTDGNIIFGAWSALVEAGSYGNYIKTELIRN